MKKYFIIFLFLFCCTKNNVHWFEGTFEEALETNDNKIIMLDFYAVW